MYKFTSSDIPPPLPHPTIGKLQGKYNKGVIQYLGLQYATLQNRFAKASMVEYSGVESINATKHGAPVVSPPGALDIEMSFIQENLPAYDAPPASDTTGLNLNITVPVLGGTDLPVLVYVHGGGFAFGSGNHPHYDQSKVVELSQIVEDQRIVAVNFNYRLGIPGFLASAELTSYGIEANRGIHDQIIALKWIQKYISGFGRDPKRITVMGQSAGAASVNFLMHNEEALFHQAILLGGSFLMMRPSSMESADARYKAIVKQLGLENLTAEARKHNLLSMTVESLTSNLTPDFFSLGPVVDGHLIPASPSYAKLETKSDPSLPGQSWCRRLFSVQSQFDGTIFAQTNLSAREDGIRAAFTKHMQSQLGDETAFKLLEFYNINEATPDNETLLAIIQLITDISFYAPAIKLAESWPGRASVGNFNERNPWNGEYHGRANHLLDTAFIWGNYNQKYKEKNWTVARAMADDIIAFVHGKDDLPDFNATNDVVVYGPSEEDVARTIVPVDNDLTKRDPKFFSLATQVGGLDILLECVQKFLG